MNNKNEKDILQNQDIQANKSKTPNPDDFAYYVQLAEHGVYPLFFSDWVRNHEMSFTELRDSESHISITKKHFKSVGHHSNIDRKKIAFSRLEQNEREELINAFMNLVDESLLDKKYRFH